MPTMSLLVLIVSVITVYSVFAVSTEEWANVQPASLLDILRYSVKINQNSNLQFKHNHANAYSTVEEGSFCPVNTSVSVVKVDDDHAYRGEITGLAFKVNFQTSGKYRMFNEPNATHSVNSCKMKFQLHVPKGFYVAVTGMKYTGMKMKVSGQSKSAPVKSHMVYGIRIRPTGRLFTSGGKYSVFDSGYRKLNTDSSGKFTCKFDHRDKNITDFVDVRNSETVEVTLESTIIALFPAVLNQEFYYLSFKNSSTAPF
jgi:hypothetical protein